MKYIDIIFDTDFMVRLAASGLHIINYGMVSESYLWKHISPLLTILPKMLGWPFLDVIRKYSAKWTRVSVGSHFKCMEPIEKIFPCIADDDQIFVTKLWHPSQDLGRSSYGSSSKESSKLLWHSFQWWCIRPQSFWDSLIVCVGFRASADVENLSKKCIDYLLYCWRHRILNERFLVLFFF